MGNLSRIALAIALITLALLISTSRDKNESDIAITFSRLEHKQLRPSSSKTNDIKISTQNWLLTRTGTNSSIRALTMIVADSGHNYRLNMSSSYQEIGCILMDSLVKVKIVDDRGDEINGVAVQWTSPAGTGFLTTASGTTLEIPLF